VRVDFTERVVQRQFVMRHRTVHRDFIGDPFVTSQRPYVLRGFRHIADQHQPRIWQFDDDAAKYLEQQRHALKSDWIADPQHNLIFRL
jgi:hypothetical protein